MKEKERVQFDFSPEALQRLDKIKEETGAKTRAETVRNALRIYEWFVNETKPESTIKIVNEHGEVTSSFKASLLHLALAMR
jgi:metal-responsive CopG/Arc/MetJ family transcriptional regulator